MPELKFPTSTPSSRLDTRSQTSGERKPVSKPRPHVLFVSPAHDDHHALGRILKDSCWRLSAATGCVDAIARHARDRMAIVVCESTLPSGSWRDLLRHVSECPDPPVLIVTSRLADEYLWAEVLNLGGYDVLAKPFDKQEVLWVLASARGEEPLRCGRAAPERPVRPRSSRDTAISLSRQNGIPG